MCAVICRKCAESNAQRAANPQEMRARVGKKGNGERAFLAGNVRFGLNHNRNQNYYGSTQNAAKTQFWRPEPKYPKPPEGGLGFGSGQGLEGFGTRPEGGGAPLSEPKLFWFKPKAQSRVGERAKSSAFTFLQIFAHSGVGA